jgi:hypothetical protein
MKRTITFFSAKAALVIVSAFFLQSAQAQWSTSGSTVFYNSGSVGIGTSSPLRPLSIVNTGFNPDNNLGLAGPGASILFSSDQTLPLSNWAKIGLATAAGHFSPTSQSGDFVIQSLTSGGNILFTTSPSTTEAFRVASNGFIGIGTTSPTAKLHNNGTVRLQNLPSGTGRVLVIDNDGNVFVSSQTARIATEEVTATDNAKITALEEKIEKLEQALQSLQQQLVATNGSIEITDAIRKVSLLEVNPNPATSATTIKYSYPANSTSAFINVNDETGKLIKRIDIKKSNIGTMNFALGEAGISSGIYIYSLEVNGKAIANKKVVLAK